MQFPLRSPSQSAALAWMPALGLLMSLQGCHDNQTPPSSLESRCLTEASFRAGKEAEHMRLSARDALAKANTLLRSILSTNDSELNFDNSFGNLNRIHLAVSPVITRADWLGQLSNPQDDLQAAVAETQETLQKFLSDLFFDEKLFSKLKRASESLAQESLSAHDRYLIRFVLRKFEFSGIGLPAERREKIKAFKGAIAELEAQAEANFGNSLDTVTVKLSADELEGVSEPLVTEATRSRGQYEFQRFFTLYDILKSAKRESARQKVNAVMGGLASENISLLRELLRLRTSLAHELGFSSWADYAASHRMAKTSAEVRSFLEASSKAVKAKWSAERHALGKLKERDTGSADLEIWDVPYYLEQIRRKTPDSNGLSEFLEFGSVVRHTLAFVAERFALDVTPAAGCESPWAGATVYQVSDRSTGELLGNLVLDLADRAGKSGGFSTSYTLNQEESREHGVSVAAVALNIPCDQNEQRFCAMPLESVSGLFHELGHATQSLAARKTYAMLGEWTSDAGEIPSMLMEKWAGDPEILQKVLRHHQDEARSVPASTLRRLAETQSEFKVHSLLGLLIGRSNYDMLVHSVTDEGEIPADLQEAANREMGRAFYGVPFDMNAVGFFYQLFSSDYAGAYYSYAWSDALARDIDSVLSARESAGGLSWTDYRSSFLATEVEPAEAVRALLGRSWDLAAYTRFLRE